MKLEKIIIEYNGWISVDKEDLKIQEIKKDGDMIDVDTSKYTSDEIVTMLKKGDVVLKSFGETYLNDTIDGEDNFTFDVENDEID
jgi:hypothetical protein